MTDSEITKARDISDRRLAALVANREDARNTAAWRDANDERAQLERQIAFSRWASRGLSLCSVCNVPVHASESDDLDRCPQCAAKMLTAP